MVPEIRIRDAHDSSTDSTAALRKRKPTVQDMYNTWRSLVQQVNEMSRLPMFIKAESRFCHVCRVLKRKCECFDYSDLELAFQTTDSALRKAALHSVPESSKTIIKTTPRTTTITATATARHSRSRTPSRARKQTTAQSPSLCNNIIKQEDFDFNNIIVSAPASAAAAAAPPTRTVVLAREIITAGGVRRWRCQFGADAGGPVCTREDENMGTIRRHYGREHGKLRHQRKPPTVDFRCSRCGYSTGTGGQQQRTPPTTCPQCKATDCIWLGEVVVVVDDDVSNDDDTFDNAYNYENAAQPTYPAAGFLSSVPAAHAGSFAAVPMPTPSPLTPMTPLTPVTPSMSAPSSVASYSPLFQFTTPATDMAGGQDYYYKADSMTLFPFNTSSVADGNVADSSSYTTLGMSFAGNNNDMGSIDDALAATTPAAMMPSFSESYNMTLTAPPAPMASTMVMDSSTAQYLPAPADEQMQMQQLQQSYSDLTGSAMTMDDVQRMTMDTTGYF